MRRRIKKPEETGKEINEISSDFQKPHVSPTDNSSHDRTTGCIPFVSGAAAAAATRAVTMMLRCMLYDSFNVLSVAGTSNEE